MEDRKARLKALAAKAGRNQKSKPDDADDDGAQQQLTTEEQEDDTTAAAKKSIKFRNYVPQDTSLDHTTTNEVEEDEPEAKRPRMTEEENKTYLQKALEEAKQEAKQQDHAVADIAAPKKINWDLKRDIQPKLEKLERRTQRAIVSLLKERLEREAAGQDEEEDLD